METSEDLPTHDRNGAPILSWFDPYRNKSLCPPCANDWYAIGGSVLPDDWDGDCDECHHLQIKGD